MAQSGYTPIQLYHSTTSGNAPSGANLVNGELAINITDGQLYYKDNSGNVQIIATKAVAAGEFVGSSAAGATIKLYEDTDNGTNYVAFQAPASIASNVTWTLPSADGTNNQVLATNGSGTLSWVDQTGGGGGGGGGGTSTTTTQFTASSGQTSFSVTYTVGQISVYLNGALLAAADYTASTGTTVVLATGATSGDILTVVAYATVSQIKAGDSEVTVTDTGSNGLIVFKTDNVERMRITSAGLVGIGTSSPAEEVHIYQSTGQVWQRIETGSSSNDAGIQYKNSTRQWSEFVNGTDGRWRLYDDTAGAERLSINSSGQVGISTSGSQANTLVVYNATTPVLQLTNSTASLGGGSGLQFYITGLDSSIINQNAGYLRFGTSGAERARFNSSGEFLLNTTTGGYYLTVGHPTDPYSNTSGSIYCGRGDASSSYCYTSQVWYNNHMLFLWRGSTAGSITGPNNASVAYNTSSDYRMKYNVQPMTNGLNKVMQLKPVTWAWKEQFGGTAGQGFLAHELQQVVPEAVNGEKDAVDENGNPVYQGVDTSFLVATLTAAIQELKAELDAVKAELAALKGN